ncbi:MAG TPA: Ig-like domain-containing protein [Longimicrobiaceae bacterium]|nr:Ig-like domain-containing protein [Longimicrobiaceae bacterium]
MRASWWIVPLAGAVGLWACGGDGGTPVEPDPPVATTIVLQPTSLTIDDGQSDTLSATVKDQNGDAMSSSAVSWSSSDTSVVSVQSGLVARTAVVAKHPGTAEITAQLGHATSQKVTVTVQSVATQLAYAAGNDQTGPVSKALPDSLVVRVLDRHGDPVQGVSVAFAVTAGNGSVSPASVASDTAGYARAGWTLGATAGDQSVEAKAAGLSGSPVTFTAHAGAASPSVLLKVSGDAQSGTVGSTLSDSVAVKITDASGNVVPDTRVTWGVTAGGGSVSPLTSVTDALGVARAAWTLGKTVSAQTLQADAAGKTVQFTATAKPGPADTVVVSPTSVALDGIGDTVSVHATVRDAYGNAVTGAPAVTWSSLDASVAKVSASGVVTAVALGSTRVRATSGSLTGSATVAVTGPEQSSFVIGDTVSGWIAPAGDADTLSFDGTLGQYIDVSLQPLNGSGDLTLQVWDVLGIGLPVVASASTELDAYTTGRLVLPRTGTFRVVVRGTNPSASGGGSGAYRFRVVPIDAAPESAPATVTIGATVTGEAISPKGDLDIFTFSGTSGQKVQVTLRPLSGSDSLRVDLYDHYGMAGVDTLGSAVAAGGSNPAAVSTAVVTLPRTATFTVVVKGVQSQYPRDDVGTYELTVKSVP